MTAASLFHAIFNGGSDGLFRLNFGGKGGGDCLNVFASGVILLRVGSDEGTHARGFFVKAGRSSPSSVAVAALAAPGSNSILTVAFTSVLVGAAAALILTPVARSEMGAAYRLHVVSGGGGLGLHVDSAVAFIYMLMAGPRQWEGRRSNGRRCLV